MTVSSRKPRHLLHVFATLKVGGPQRRFAAISNELGGHIQHTVHAMDGRYEALGLLTPEVRVNRLENICEIPQKGSRILAFRKVLSRIRPDCLLTYNWGSVEWAFASKLSTCRCVHFEDGFGPEEATKQLSRRVWARRLILRGQTQVIVPSHVLYDLASNHWRLPKKNLHYLPNGVDLTRFQFPRSKEPLKLLNVPLDGPHLVTVAALRPEKNLSRLLRAFASIVEKFSVRLIIVGDGPERSRLEQEAKTLSIQGRIHFLGHMDDPERVLAASDIFVLSSDTEQMPLSVLEAMAMGLPIVSTDVGDVKRMVSCSNKDFVSGHDVGDLTACLTNLLSQPENWDIIGRSNSQEAEDHYSVQKMVSDHQKLYVAKN